MRIVNEVTIYELIIPYISTIITLMTAGLYIYMDSRLHAERYSAMLKVILTMVVFNFGYLLQIHFVLHGYIKTAGNMYAISQFGLTFLMPYSILYIKLLVRITNPKVEFMVVLVAKLLLVIGWISVPLSFASANFDFEILHWGTRVLPGSFDSNLARLAVPEVYFSIRNASYLLIGFGSVGINVYYCNKNKHGFIPMVLSLAFLLPLIACIFDFFAYIGKPLIFPLEAYFLRLTIGTALFSITAFVASISMFVAEYFSIDDIRGKLAVVNIQNETTIEQIRKSRNVFLDVEERLSEFVKSLNVNATSVFSSCKVSVLYTKSLIETSEFFYEVDERQKDLYDESRRRIDGIYSSFEVLKKAVMGQASTLDNIVDDIGGSSDILEKVESKIMGLRQSTKDLVMSYSQVKVSMVDSFKHLDSIVEISSSVRKSIVFIKDISEKTNLLSVNANIQASKSSAWQDSFSVVAEEMSNLALDSKIAAERIDSLFMLVTKTTNEFILTKNYIVQVFDSIIENISATMTKITLISNIVSAQLADNKTISQNTKFALELNTYIAEEIESRYDEIYEVIQKFDALDEQFEFFRDMLGQQTNEVTKLSHDMDELITSSKELNSISENITDYTEIMRKEIRSLPAS